jgi:8-oxo-dGTP pyrophosphatase MutT (NUDIX family)
VSATASSGESAPPLFSVEDFRRRARGRLAQEPLLRPPGDPSSDVVALSGRVLSAEAALAARPAAVLVPIVARDEPTVLLTQRARALRSHSGQIAFPGGKIDQAGESVLEAALRETREEIGLSAENIDPIGYLDPCFTGSGYRIVPVVAIIAPPFELALNEAEVEAAFEAPLRFLMSAANHQRVTRPDGAGEHYAMPYGERYIWGATAGMLRLMYEKLYA